MEELTIDSNKNDRIPDALRKNIETSEITQEKIASILEQQKKTQSLVDKINIPKFEVSSKLLDIMRNINDNSALRAVQDTVKVMNSGTLQMSSEINTVIATVNNNAIKNIGELSIKSSLLNYQFDIPTIKIWDNWGIKVTENLISSLNTLVNNSAMIEIQSVTSKLGKWLKTVDFSPLTRILEIIRAIGFDFDYKEINEIFLKAMFDAKWFPYAGWIADYTMVDEIFEILDTSRVSKNRIKRIDRLIFSYYNKDEINNLNSRANASAFSDDSSYFLLAALEVVEDGKLIRKADMFTKRTIKPHIPVTHADTASEALALSIGEKARVDIEYMQALTGKDEDTLFNDLQGVIFLNPLKDNPNEPKYLMADEYLSGNVREKLKEAKQMTEAYPKYQANVIVDSSDIVIAFWNGKSRVTKYVIDYCHKKHKNLRVYICNK